MKYLFLLVCLPLMAVTDFDVGGTVGYRRDHFRWSIGIDGIDILSELTWRDLNIVEARGEASLTIWECWRLWGEGAYGVILGGEGQDSDYWQSGRLDEFSRSLSEADGYVTHLIGGLGYRGSSSPFSAWGLMPLTGVAFDQIDLRDHAAIQVLYQGWMVDWPFEDQGTSGKYRADWLTWFMGLQGRWRPIPLVRILANLRGHVGIYRGYGNWVMRDDFDHFKHRAAAWAVVGDGKILFHCIPHGYIHLTAGAEYWATEKDGHERLEFSDGHVCFLNFREAQWIVLRAGAGFTFIF